MQEFRHIAVEGVPGSGKSAIARALAGRINARVVLDLEENPFLERFLEDMSQYAFQVQMYYLLSRYRIDETLYQPSLFQHHVVTDYLFDRDEIYASITLSADELILYRQLYNLLVTRRPPPDMVVYLQLTPQEAIRRRPDLDPDYLRLVTGAYEDFFFRFTQTPLLVVRADEFDPVTRERDLDEFVRALHHHGNALRGETLATAGGTVYFSPPGRGTHG